MRRENRGKNRVNSNTAVFITGGVLLLAIATFVITFIVYSNKLDSNMYALDSEYIAQYTNSTKNDLENNTSVNEETASASSSIGKTVEESQNTTTEENKTEEVKEDTTKQETTKTTSKSTTKNEVEEKDPVFESPIAGEVMKEFAKDSLIYSETLKEWTTHLGIDIKAERATVVKAAAAGTVKDIKNDPRFGLTIIIEHSNGFETRYANLLTTEFVSEGEEVKAGQTIGTVGDSAVYEIVDESHLHFEILKDSENVNPSEYIKFE